jgi:hypothetical protein
MAGMQRLGATMHEFSAGSTTCPSARGAPVSAACVRDRRRRQFQEIANCLGIAQQLAQIDKGVVTSDERR